MKVKVNQKISIGDGEKPFIIAEIGSNWLTIDDCFFSIKQAKYAGADAVKFQVFDHESLYGSHKNMAHVLPVMWLPALAARCNEIGIEFMCSAFSPELAELVNPYVNIPPN